MLDREQIETALAGLDLGMVTAVTELSGGHAAVFKVDLADGRPVILKVYRADHTKPDKDAFAAALLRDRALPIAHYLLVDDSRAKLPFGFAITSYLPGVAAGSLKNHLDIASLYRQTGALLRSLHEVKMPAYGAFGAEGIVDPLASNEASICKRIAHSFEWFVAMGGEPALGERLRDIAEARFDSIVPFSKGAVFAHDDLHPNNVLGVEDESGKLVLSGLIDFGNARAADPVVDLAKCLFCSEHDAPGSTPHILAGYGEIEHPDPAGALWYYTLLHRVTMWCWLRRVGVIATADTPSGLIDDLRMMTA
ncbi:Aminoglycoside phosphotransferase [Devosia sp. LC5]|uniref:phosphotransferase enzyme family protein n=1 Tax=Devosia sp. LC5 TaxID=1502724 RepID=UPI0004E35B26|nr:aminoglycoside phosphotransferase family protein [Devosia sp. LC5]KFC66061.1 Aminoglycoside phosphotransferase [Devosia sp. LC5]